MELPDAEKRKVVIYLKWAGLINLVAVHLRQLGVPVAIASGATPVHERDRIVNAFMADESQPSIDCLTFDPEAREWRDHPSVPCRALIITDAMGAGVNLQRASVLINLDPPWSYAEYLQVIGRVVRIGQEREVQIFDLIAKDTIDEWLVHILKLKRTWTELASTVASAIAPYISKMENREIAFAARDDEGGNDVHGDDLGEHFMPDMSTSAKGKLDSRQKRDRFGNEVDEAHGICPACDTALYTKEEAAIDTEGFIEHGTCRTATCTWPSPEYPDHLRAYQPWDSNDPRTREERVGERLAEHVTGKDKPRQGVTVSGDVIGLKGLGRSLPSLDHAWRRSPNRQTLIAEAQRRLKLDCTSIATVPLSSTSDESYEHTAKLLKSAIWRFFAKDGSAFDSRDLRIRDIYDPASWPVEELTEHSPASGINQLMLFLYRCFTLRIAHELEQYCFLFVLSSLRGDDDAEIDEGKLLAALRLLTTNGEFSFEAARSNSNTELASVLQELAVRLEELDVGEPHEPTAWLAESYSHRFAASLGTCSKAPAADEATRHWRMPFPLLESKDSESSEEESQAGQD